MYSVRKRIDRKEEEEKLTEVKIEWVGEKTEGYSNGRVSERWKAKLVRKDKSCQECKRR